jgi:hypothetical protein
VAIPGLALTHVPPASPLLLSVVVEPAFTVVVPLMVPELAAVTFNVRKVLKVPQPVIVYDIRAVPAAIPLATPVTALTVAMAVADELQAYEYGGELVVVDDVVIFDVPPTQIGFAEALIVPGSESAYTVFTTVA